MSETGERTEEATPRQRQEARCRGQVAKSTDLAAAGCLVISGGALMAMAGTYPASILRFARRLWGGETEDQLPRTCSHGAALTCESIFGPEPDAALREAFSVGVQSLLPIMLVCAVAGILATLVQVGLVFAPKVIVPDMNRLSPVKGAKRLFSAARLMVIPRTAVTLSLAIGIVWTLTRPRLPDILSMPAGTAEALAVLVRSHVPTLVLICGLALLVPGALDFVMAHRKLAKELRMTRQQVRDEHKRDEGDPVYKNQRRQTHRELSASPSRPLNEAKVLVVNPTRLAVALHHGADIPVPMVGARGSGESAARMRRKARSLGIPIVRDVPLARALITLAPNSPVPEPLFAAVAAVLATVYRAELAVQASQGTVSRHLE